MSQKPPCGALRGGTDQFKARPMSDAAREAGTAVDAALAARIDAIAPGRVSGLRQKDGVLSLVLDVSELEAAERDAFAARIKAAGEIEPGISDVRIAMTAERSARPLIVAVGSGKGGVGKSTLSVNLAVALKRLGKKVGMVDADIYGPSLPRLLDSEGVKPGQAIAWRGPMAGNALGQLIDADWRGTEILIVDLPPGTGDVQLTMIQKYKPAGAVIISTPQDLALIDAARAISFFDQAKVPVIGMVENMSGYVCPHCGEVSDPFGSGGAEADAARLGLPFLGRVPLDIAVRTASDNGMPPAAEDGVIGQPFRAIAERVARWLDGGAGRASPAFG
jgi:ATP-binding protein involved in chromosome partitioning